MPLPTNYQDSYTPTGALTEFPATTSRGINAITAQINTNTTAIAAIAASGSGHLPCANILDYGAVANSDSTVAIQNAWATGLPVFIPPGTYNYNGTPLAAASGIWGQGTCQLFGAGPGVSCLQITGSQYLIDNPSSTEIFDTNIHDLMIYGGYGAYRDQNTGTTTTPSAVRKTFTNCLFWEYTLAAIADRHLDGPYWLIDSCHFVGANNTTCIGIAFCGLKDSTTIRSSSFYYNRIGLKLSIPPSGEYGGAGGNVHISDCDFIRAAAQTSGYPQIDIWVVPGNVSTPNNGWVFDVVNTKFGNENLSPGDFRIVYADASSLTAANNETATPVLTTLSTGQVTGHHIRDIGWAGAGNAAGIPLVYSTTTNVTGCVIGPIFNSGDGTAPLLQFYNATGWDPGTCIIGPIVGTGADLPDTRTRVTTLNGSVSSQPKQWSYA
jgi:hypothetical protein